MGFFQEPLSAFVLLVFRNRAVSCLWSNEVLMRGVYVDDILVKLLVQVSKSVRLYWHVYYPKRTIRKVVLIVLVCNVVGEPK